MGAFMHRRRLAIIVMVAACGAPAIAGAQSPCGEPPGQPDEPVRHAAERLLALADALGGGVADEAFRTRVGRARSVDALAAAAEHLVTLRIHVNPESRVKLRVVHPVGDLVVGRPRPLLVAIVNEAGVTAPLSLSCRDRSLGAARPADFCRVTLRDDGLSAPRLGGAALEWKLADITVAAPGRWEVGLEADVGQGTQDLGFRSTADVLLRGVRGTGGEGGD